MIAFDATPYYEVSGYNGNTNVSYLLKCGEKTDFSIGYSDDDYNPYDLEIEQPINPDILTYQKNNNVVFKCANQIWGGLNRFDIIKDGIVYRHLPGSIFLVFGDNLPDEIHLKEFEHISTTGKVFKYITYDCDFFGVRFSYIDLPRVSVIYSVQYMKWDTLPYYIEGTSNKVRGGTHEKFYINYEGQFRSYYILTKIKTLKDLTVYKSVKTNNLIVCDNKVDVDILSNIFSNNYVGEYLAAILNEYGGYEIDDDKENPDMEISTDINVPDIWGKSPAFDMGFISAYVPTPAQLQQLSYKMHSKDFWTALANLFNNLDDGVISLGLLPFTIPPGPSQELKFAWVSTGVSMPLVQEQNIRLNLGTVAIPTIYKNFLDYSPNTKVKIFLPFLGERDLSVDDVIGKILTLYYNVDVLTGDFVAHVSVEGNDLYHWTGNCMMHLPISSRSFQSLFNSYVSMVSSIGRGVIGTTIPASGSKAYQIASKNASNASNAMGAIESIGNYIVNSKPTLSHNGDASGSSGYLDVLTPYIYIERPNYQEPDDYDALYGKPSNSTVTLSQLTGFVKVSQIHLVGISATDTELDEIVRLLKEGVIL